MITAITALFILAIAILALLTVSFRGVMNQINLERSQPPMSIHTGAP